MLKETYYGLNRDNNEHIEKLKYVLSQVGPKRWRAAANLYLYLNPKSYVWDPDTYKRVVAMDAQTEARIIAEECAQLRQAYKDSWNPKAQSAGSMIKGDEQTAERRYMLRMPATMLQFIQMIDPDLMGTTKGEAGRREWEKLKKEFKEFQIGV